MGKKQKDKKEKKVLTLSEFNAEIAPDMPATSIVLPDAPLGAEEWEKQGIAAFGRRAGQVPREYRDRGERGGDRDHEGGGGRYGGRGEGEEEEERDWTRRGPMEQLPRGAGQGGFKPRGEFEEEGGARREERDFDWGERRGPLGPSGGHGPAGMTDNTQGPREELDWSQRRGPVAAEPSLHPQANVDWSNVRRGAPPPMEQQQGGRPQHPDVDFRDVRGTAKVELFTQAPAHVNIDFKDMRGSAKVEPAGVPRQDIDFRDVRGSAKVEPVQAHPVPHRDTEFKDVRGSAQLSRPREKDSRDSRDSRDNRDNRDSKDIDWSVRKAPVEVASPETKPHDASPVESAGSDHQQQPRYRERGAVRGGYHEHRGEHGERPERYHNHGPREREHNDNHGHHHPHEHNEQDWSAVRTGDGIPAQPAQPADAKSFSSGGEEVTWKPRKPEASPNVESGYREDRKTGERGDRVDRVDRGDRGDRGDHRRPVGEKKPNRDVDWSQRRGPMETPPESEDGKASSSSGSAAPAGGDPESNVQYRPRNGPPRRRNERADRNRGDDDQGQWVKIVPPSTRTHRKDERGGDRRGGRQAGDKGRPRGDKPGPTGNEGGSKGEEEQTTKLDIENPFQTPEETKEGETATAATNGDAPSVLEAGA